jgi:RHS repeat-associated protein
VAWIMWRRHATNTLTTFGGRKWQQVWARLHPPAAGTLTLTLAASLLTVNALPASASPTKPAPPMFPSVRGAVAKPTRLVRPHNDAAAVWRPPPVSWPAAGSAVADLSGLETGAQDIATRTGRVDPLPVATTARAGTLPVRLDRTTGGGPTRVRVALSDRAAAQRAGVTGLLLTVAPADVASGSGTVRVSVDYRSIVGAYGGDFGQRLHLVTMPGCALTTPQVPACQTQTPLAGTNTTADRSITGQITLSASGTPGAQVVLAATAGPSGNSGDYSATALRPSGSWTAGGNSGDFTYRYPIAVPPVPGGLVPSVALSYSAQSVDGEQVATNNQPSWIGDGWNYSPGYIERSYVPCADDPAGTAPKTGDSCWVGQILHVSFGSTSGDLVYDANVPTHWRISNDDGTRVEQLTGGHNGTFDGDYWKLTTRDGTRYFFGLNQLPGYGQGKSATNSAWTEPVYGAHAGDPCNSAAGFGASSCTQAWRWNLDYVVDTHHDAAAYFYNTETNLYGANLGTSGVSYVRSGWLDHIDYGLTDPTPYAGQAAARVQFTTGERCVESPTVCAPGNFNNAKSKWPDVPGDQSCDSGKPCANHSPTFWSRKRLTGITTQISTGTAWTTVDSYALKQSFPDPGDGTTPAMWLDSIQRTGGSGAGAITLPAVSFASTKLANRVDGVDGAPAMYHHRISTITTETGEIIAIQYETECAPPVRIDPANNGSLCYPVYWTMEGHTDRSLDWFHKYRVRETDNQDPTGNPGPSGTRTPPVTTAYSYLGGAAWHFDDNELVKARYRTYGQWRGYGRVQTRTGAGLDPKALFEAIFYRGMDGDTLPGGGRRGATVALSGAVGVPGAANNVPDTNELSGSTREEIAYNGDGGPVDHATVTDYWVSPPTAQRPRAGLPDLTATMNRTVSTRTTTATTSTNPTSWRTTQTDTTYDPATGLPTVVYAHGDITRPDQARCTVTSYAPINTDANLVGLPVEVETDAAACDGSGVNGLTAPSRVNRPTDVVSDLRTFYDDPAFATGWPQPAPSVGDVSLIQQASDYTGGSFVYINKSRTSYDAHGRPTQVIDANNNASTTAYTDTNGLTTKIATNNPLRQTTTSTLDPTRGLTVTTVDANQLQTDQKYDVLGRLTGVWRPGMDRSVNAYMAFSYVVSQTSPSAITTRTLTRNGAKLVVTLYDALARPRQTQTTIPPTGGPIGKLVTDTFYDSRGWATKVNNAYYNDSGPPGTQLVDVVGMDNQIPNQDLITFDGLGRKTIVVSNSMGHAQWQTTTIYGGDRTTTIPPQGGTPTTTVVDALGRTTELNSYTSPPTVTGGQVSGPHTAIRYGYDHRGNQATVTDDAGSTWTSGYDLLGRVTAKTDPDAGSSTLTYDNVSNLLAATDARNKIVSYSYDSLNRKTGAYDGPTSASPKLAAWTYDTASNGIGKPASSTSYDNGYAYTSTVSGGYDKLGNPLGVTVTVPPDPANGGLAGSYTFTNTYTTDTGTLLQTRYPNAGGLPSETVSYGYDNIDNPTAVGGLGDYVDSSYFTPFSQPQSVQLGFAISPNSATLGYVYEQHAQRLTGFNIAYPGQGTPNLEHRTYTYTPAGQITSTTETRQGTTSETQCFDYDLLDRLTEAWTSSDNCATDVPATGDNTTVKGISPYWTSWSYNTAGDRTGQTQHALADTTVDTVTSYQYTGSQPHTLSATSSNGPAGISATSYGYDQSGNTTTRTTPENATQNLRWDSQGRLAAVMSGSAAAVKVGPKLASAGDASYIYDADGKLLVQRNPGAGSTTLYLPAEELMLSAASGSVTGKRYYGIGDVTAVRTGTKAGDYSYLIDHPQGTATLSLDHNAHNPVWRDFTPYGAPRGSQPSAWPDSHAFLGKPTDPTTGLDLLGARQYDPTIGRFLSPDPVFQATDPNQLGGYTYSGDDPVNKTDPTGLDPCPHGGGGCANDGTDPATTQTPPANGCSGPFCYSTPASSCSSDNTCTHHSGGGACSINCLLQQNAAGNDPPMGFLHNNGYTGSSAFTVGDAIKWAGTSRMASVWVCEHVFGGSNEYCGDTAQGTDGPLKLLEVFAGSLAIAGVIVGSAACAEGYFACARVGFSVLNGAASFFGYGGGGSPLEFGGVEGAEAEGVLLGRCNSFDPDTPVLMTHGKAKAIKDVTKGDEVEATDPDTKTTTGERVTKLHDDVDFDLADLVVTDVHGHQSIIHTTQHHRFWDVTTNRWTDAIRLRRGDLLYNPWGAPVRVAAVRAFFRAKHMLNLSVANVHTYYVMAGNTPVLVHNTGCGTFTHGELFEHTMSTPNGDVGMLAETQIEGTTLHLNDVAVYGDGMERGALNQAAVLRELRTVIAPSAANQGFDTLVIRGTRYSGPVGHEVNLRIDLTKYRSR